MNASTAPHLLATPTLVRTSRASFDVFDTLIARRCVEPAGIFALMGERIGQPGWAQVRQDAERAVAQRAYTLADIYRQLQHTLRLTDADAEALMQLEVQIELENVIPIAEHLSSAPADALLISDMYLPPDVVREMLRRAGLVHDLPLLLHSQGKASGQVWRDLRAGGVQCSHLGDSEASDVLQARRHGMRARHTRLHAPTPFESLLRKLGAEQAACALRAARLATRQGALPPWLYLLQMNLNLPLLLVCAADLLGQAVDVGASDVLFASRDGRNLQTAFETLRGALPAAAGVQARYWYTSRVARTSQHPHYLDYCRSVFGPDVIVADLCGTGASMTRLLADLGAAGAAAPQCYVGQWVDRSCLGSDTTVCHGLSPAQALAALPHTFSTRGFVDNTVLETLNYLPEGMVRGVLPTCGGVLPLRDAPEFDGPALALIAEQHRVLTDLLVALRSELDAPAMDGLLQAVPAMRDWLCAQAPTFAPLLDELKATFGADDAANEVLTMADLRGATR